MAGLDMTATEIATTTNKYEKLKCERKTKAIVQHFAAGLVNKLKIGITRRSRTFFVLLFETVYF